MSSLNTFRESGVLRAIDVQVGRALNRMVPESCELVLLGAAAASRVHGTGHICLELDRFREQVRHESTEEDVLPWPEGSAWLEALEKSPLVRRPGEDVHTPLVLEGRRLYLDRYWSYQLRLSAQIQSRVQRRPFTGEHASLTSLLDGLFPEHDTYDPKMLQRKAAETAALHGFSIVTGGPGTGKTTTIKRLMALLIQQAKAEDEPAPKFLLMAPTGKAAARMKESLRESGGHALAPEILEQMPDEASTIHRALGFNPRTPTVFKRNASRPLDADVVIVDEASMVDLALMTKLVEAVAEDARLILLGDADQLASVEAGAVLGDLCGGLRAGVVRLEYTHRFGTDSGVGALSRAIKAGDALGALQLLERNASERDEPYEELKWLGVEESQSYRGARKAIRTHLETLVVSELKCFFDAVEGNEYGRALKELDNFRVLAAHREGLLGVSGLNQAIERWLFKAGMIDLSTENYQGRPVLVLENDREQELYNGDVGFMAMESGKAVAIFPDMDGAAYRVVPAGRLPPHETVYAMTVHKSQGSQLKHALLALPLQPSRILTRELLYTAVTRAQTRVTVIGAEETFKAGVNAYIERSSGLGDALQDA